MLVIVKNVFPIVLGYLILTLPMPVKVFAVWPPSTTLNEEDSQAPVAKDVNSFKVTSDRARQLVDHLEEDERRLDQLLRELEAYRQEWFRKTDEHK